MAEKEKKEKSADVIRKRVKGERMIQISRKRQTDRQTGRQADRQTNKQEKIKNESNK